MLLVATGIYLSVGLAHTSDTDRIQSKNIQNVIQMALKWLFFSEKLQELLSGWGLRPYLSNLAVSNCSKNVQNVIQMAIF